MTTEEPGLDEQEQRYQAAADAHNEAFKAAREIPDTKTVSDETRAPKGELSERDKAYQELVGAGEEAEEAEEEEEPATTSGDGTAPVFDPSAHNVGAVLAYVDAHPDQLALVLAQERSGQNRVTLVQQLETRQ